MQKVIHASLHGNAWAIEEAGYEALRAYLDRAAQQLAADPDREEIIGDLEQAIADKCARFCSPHKSVVTAGEMAQVLAEMGPVGAPDPVGPESTGSSPGGPAAPAGGPAADPASAPSTQGEPPPRRLYRVLEGGRLGGVCNGLGAYFQIDATLVRVIFVLLALLTHGAWLLVYAVLMFVIPAAGTPEERAAARGLPFSAQELIDEAKRHYAQLEQELRRPWARWKASWSRDWRHDARVHAAAERAARREWKAEYRAERKAERRAAREEAAAVVAAHSSTYAQQLATGVALPALALLSAALTVAWLVASAMLLVSGTILGWSPGLPLWASLLLVLLVTMVIGQPFQAARSALRRSSMRWGHWHLLAWDGLLWFGFAALLCWQAWTHVPEVRQLAREAPAAMERVRASWQAKAP
jgi:phage shock protein PspC (stress-responsive transcriptional regulator)